MVAIEDGRVRTSSSHCGNRHRNSNKKCCLERLLASVKEVLYCIWLSRNHQRVVSSSHAVGGCRNTPGIEGREKGRSRSFDTIYSNVDNIPNDPQEKRDTPVDLSCSLSKACKKELNS